MPIKEKEKLKMGSRENEILKMDAQEKRTLKPIIK